MTIENPSDWRMSEACYLDKWTGHVVAPGHSRWTPLDHPRSEKLGKVFVTPTTKALLAHIGDAVGLGASGVAALLIEELRHEGQLEQVWKAQRNRRRRLYYQKKHGARHIPQALP